MWVDASNFTGPFTDQMCQDLLAAGVVGVILQAVTGADGKSYTRQQLGMCVKWGLRIQGYVFPGGLAAKLALFNGYTLEGLWLDVELPISKAGVDSALAQCDAYIGGKTGIYTAYWFFKSQGWLRVTWWADRPLWDMSNDRTAVLNDHFVPYGGWNRCVTEQYLLDTSIGSVHQIDLDSQ